jgi:hypothetical protein
MQRRVELENEARKTIAQILGGAAVLAGVFFTAQQLFVAQDAQRIAEEALITERFTRATEQLGNDRLEIRIGGIYAFERIAKNSEDDFYPVINILSTFIRENAPRQKDEEDYPNRGVYADPGGLVELTGILAADISAALQSLRSLSLEHDKRILLDLNGTNLEGGIFGEGSYEQAWLFNSNLQYASLIGVHLPGALLFDSNLRGANLQNANLSGADFRNAQLNDANLRGVDLSRANL